MRSARRAVAALFGDAPELRPLSLHLDDPELERSFQQDYFRTNLRLIRIAHLFGLGGWVALGILAQQVLSGHDATADALIRFIAVPLILLSLALTYRSWFAERWQPMVAGLVLLNGGLWLVRQAIVDDLQSEWGYSGLMLILAFCYILSRMQFVSASLVGAALIAGYNVVIPLFRNDKPQELLFADYFLVVFAFMGMAAAYGRERSDRLLFLRQRELERERRRADELLHNTLPATIVARLKGRDPAADHEYLADGHRHVTVLFADLVAFTEHASVSTPQDLVSMLDRIFTGFDRFADRLGLEKIKTIGDAYLAVAGAPDDRADHAEAAAELALAILDAMADQTWPNGEPMQIRIGMASGPAVAGVIGRRKFAYDLWGDTVNLASRLESGGEPGQILVSEPTAHLLAERYERGERRVVDLKGKGPTPAYVLLGRKRVAAGDPPARANTTG